MVSTVRSASCRSSKLTVPAMNRRLVRNSSTALRPLRERPQHPYPGLAVELPGIEPERLPAETPSDLQVGFVSIRFVPARFLRKQTRLLTPSRAVIKFTALAPSTFQYRPGDTSPVAPA